MKASASPDTQPTAVRPSRALGLLLSVVLLATVWFVLWQISGKLFVWFGPSPPEFQTQNWVLAASADAALIGWIVSALTTIRNSVKQHTINTLLQSRLSATYMGHVDKVGGHFAKYAAAKQGNPKSTRTPVDGIDKKSLGYILNYYEFIAIGIRHGDLDENVLKSSLRSIVGTTVFMSKILIDDAVKSNPRSYCNLLWLYGRWRDPALEERLSATPDLPAVLEIVEAPPSGPLDLR